ncbi:Glutathione-dependent formaldehyde-activating enzyme [Roseivivax jejudonensis]|uniref:Glutathione-dependent formaldehyde-activating enzyme n=1 Tax=Roseivivax jejudonensis TaxID=1529041 RepID=A0A1X7A294_9RHOB|nr:GFA family protein [Roseivivax jejudonensis]SLN68606.1 Glutathione-dependent formaldehyde-activating enzyme [Roseivivax jejudonensis]
MTAAGPIDAPVDLVGRCLCGAVTIRAAAVSPRVQVCHCEMCRRWTGGLYAMFTAPPDGVQVEGAVRTYRASSFAERAFCPTCGSHLWLRDDDAEYELMPGMFPGAADFPLQSEVYADHALAAMTLSGSHERTDRATYEADNPFVPEEDLP